MVVVVVTHEVVHGIVGEELLELACELSCQRLVGCENERGHLQALDGLGHREGLARTGDAKQRLVAHATLYAVGKTLDCLRLIARELIGRDALEGIAPLAPTVNLCTLRAVHV